MGWDVNNKVTYSEEIDAETRNHRDSLKSVASKAQTSDHNVKMAGNRIYVNGKPYGYEEMDILPPELRRGITQTKRTKEGVAFRGKECYLSNFYLCDLMIDGELYASVEQFYQHIKCLTCEDHDRAANILCTDDPLHAKVLGDGCEVKEDWIQSKVYTMFKGMFHKFVQNEDLAYKLPSTENLHLYEATTDKLYGAGIGLNSKKCEMRTWEGKNVCGKLLCKIRKILRKKLDEGLELKKLVFNYSLPSLRDDPSNRHFVLFGGMDQDDENVSIRAPCDMSLGGDELLPSQNPTILNERGVDEDGNLTQLIEAMENPKENTDKDESSLFTLCDRVVRRKSHSIENTHGGHKARNNPKRQPDSLTRRQRAHMYRTEQVNQEDMIEKQLGFDRCYGISRDVVFSKKHFYTQSTKN